MESAPPNFQLRFLRGIVSSAFAMLDVRRLRVLREFAARGTIAATADALGYTPPAVSQQLAALEREAGVDLLERNGRTRRLTPAGQELVSRTEAVLRELEAADASEHADTPWIAGREGSFCHEVVLHVCRAAGFEPRIAHFTNDFATAYGLVAAGVGFALVPDLAGPPPPGVEIVATKQPVPSRRIFAAVRSGSGARPAVAACLDALMGR